LEDAGAILEAIDERRRVIREHAWRQSGNWEQVYVEATRMRGEIERLKELLSARWEELFGVVQNAENAENADHRTGTD